jgi:hypothetical protein
MATMAVCAIRQVGVPKKRANASAFWPKASLPKAGARWRCGAWKRKACGCAVDGWGVGCGVGTELAMIPPWVLAETRAGTPTIGLQHAPQTGYRACHPRDFCRSSPLMVPDVPYGTSVTHSGESCAGLITRGLTGHATIASPGYDRRDAFHEDQIAHSVL